MLCLVVDDSKSARFTLKKLLISLEQEVIQANSGEEALELLCVEQPDLIFLDYQMPGMNGFETAKKIRSQKLFTQTPIVICSANDHDDDDKQFERLGILTTLPKPAEPQAIQKILKSIDQASTNLEPTTQAPSVQETAHQVNGSTQATQQVTPQAAGLTDDLRVLIQAEAEGRAKKIAQQLLDESWGRLRGGLQEEVRQQTNELIQRQLQSSIEQITHEVRLAISASLSKENRQYADRKFEICDQNIESLQNESKHQIHQLKRQLEYQKFDPVALHDTVLEDAKRAAEFTATHKTVETVKKVSYQVCEDVLSEMMSSIQFNEIETDIEVLKSTQQQLMKKHQTILTITSGVVVLTGLTLITAIYSFL